MEMNVLGKFRGVSMTCCVVLFLISMFHLVAISQQSNVYCSNSVVIQDSANQTSNSLYSLLAKIGTNKPRNPCSRYDMDTEGAITNVWLYGEDISDDNVKMIANISSLQVVVLLCSTNRINVLNENSFKALQKTKKLRKIVIYGGLAELTKEMCMAIASLKQLEVFVVEFCPIDAEGKKYLKTMNWLKKIELPDE